MDLRPRAPAPEPALWRHVVLDRSVPARSREPGGDRVRRVLVLPEARIPPDVGARPTAPRARGGPARGPPVLPVLPAHAREARHRKRALRDRPRSGGSVGPVPRPEHRARGPAAGGGSV